jgi:outer membrane protein
MKKIGLFLAIGIFSLALLSPAQGAETLKFGYVDMQKALNTCEAGKEAKKLITEEVEKVQNAFAAKQRDVERIKSDLEKRGSVLSEAVRQEKEKEYQAKLRDLQRMQRDSEDDIRRKDREYTEKILRQLEAIAKKLGEERKYTAIFEKNQPSFIYISSALDMTDEVIRMMDASSKKK